MLWLAAADGRIKYMNRQWLAYTGLTFEEAAGPSGWTRTVHPDDLQAATAAFAAGIGSGRRFEFEIRLKSAPADASAYRWHLIQNAPVRDFARLDAAWIGTATDIHERKIASEALRTLSDAVPSIVFSAGADGAIDFVNREWMDYTGLTADESMGAAWTPFVHPDDAAAVVEAWTRSIREGRRHEHTFRLRRARDGAYRWHVARAIPARDEHGNVTRWYGATTDIDDAKRAQQRMQRLVSGGDILARSLDYETVLDNVAVIAVSSLARYCVIDMLDEGGLQRIAFASKDDATELVLDDVRALAPSLDDLDHPIVRAAHGVSSHVDMTSEHWPKMTMATSGRAPAFSKLDIRSAISVPLQSAEGIHGALTMMRSSGDRRPFDAEDLLYAEELGRQAGSALANARLYGAERRVATRLQAASLPASLPTRAGITFDAVYVPGNAEAEIGGDWYDAVTLPDGRIVLSVGDVLGSGLEAAVTMGRLRQTMRTAAVLSPDLGAILRAADAMLRLDDPNALATALVAIIDLAAGTMEFASAGHPAPMFAAGDIVREAVVPHGPPLGLRDDAATDVGRIALSAGMLVVLYTDGLTEATRDIAQGEARLRAALAAEAERGGDRPALAIKDAVLADGSRDDVAVLTFRIG